MQTGHGFGQCTLVGRSQILTFLRNASVRNEVALVFARQSIKSPIPDTLTALSSTKSPSSTYQDPRGSTLLNILLLTKIPLN